MRRRDWVSIGLAALSLVACEKNKESARGKTEDLTIVVEADRSKLSQQEQQLQGRLETFERERQRFRDEKASLMLEKQQIKGKGRAALHRHQQMEQRLWERERGMWEREAALEKERQRLAQGKDELWQKVATASPGASPDASMAAREGAIAVRERSLARREADLASREKALATREAEFLKLQARLNIARPPAVPRTIASGGKVSLQAADRAFKAARGKMQRRGILWTDLPLEMAGLRKEILQAKKGREYSRVMDLVGQLEAALAATVIDAGFIDRKIARLNNAIKGKPPENRQAISSLLRKATQLVGDGKYQAANRELNRILALLNR